MIWGIKFLILPYLQALEDFVWQAADLLDRLDDFQEDLSRNDFADDVNGAKHGIDVHNDMKKKIMKAPVEDIDILGQRLLQRYESLRIPVMTKFYCSNLWALFIIIIILFAFAQNHHSWIFHLNRRHKFNIEI